MEQSIVWTSAATVRRMIAHAMLDRGASGSDGRTAAGRSAGTLGSAGSIPSMTVGAVTLRPHQCSAVVRLRAVMQEFGGALLADDAGLGKTYVAAALARDATRPLIVAPASLRGMWLDALRATDVRAELTSYSTLSRGGGPSGPFDLLVLDEAHHARTPSTRRYARLAELARSARVLLLSATPIHNTRRDLCALFALFLGAHAWTMDDTHLARCIVRRERHDVRESVPIPTATPPRRIEIGNDDDMLDAILALPPPIPPSDGGDGGALLVWSLARQWASSQGALATALRRRLARAAALGAALESGRHPSRSELASWAFTGDAVQLAFPELIALTEHAHASELLAAMRAHEHAIRALLGALRHSPDLDAVRAERLTAIRAAHPGEKVVAFTQYTETVRALYERLRRTPGIAALTASGARVAGGTLTRREAIARFAPHASNAPVPPIAERIELLLATDVLSEGLNLQDASVVVHLDLPWTPARLEQRVGRSRRIGARHARTTVYVFAPPAATESLMHVEARLREKLHAAGHVIGASRAILPIATDVSAAAVCEEDDGEDPPPGDTSAARTIELLYQALAGWGDANGRRDGRADLRGQSATRGQAQGCGHTTAHGHSDVDGQSDIHGQPQCIRAHTPLHVAAVRSEHRGVIALLRHRGAPVLVAALDDHHVTRTPSTVLAAVRAACGDDVSPDALPELDEPCAHALAMIERWCMHADAAVAAGSDTPLAAHTRHTAMRRIAAITARAPHHRRALLAPLVSRAQRVVTSPYGIGAERLLEELVQSELDDDAWLHAVDVFGARFAAAADSTHTDPETRSSRSVVMAILLLHDGC